MHTRSLSIVAFCSLLASGCGQAAVSQVQEAPTVNPSPSQSTTNPANAAADPGLKPVAKTEAEWKERLAPDEYHVLRRKGTERAFANEYWDNKQAGVYRCRACGQPLFSSETKYESGTGWPSYWAPLGPDAVDTVEDRGFFSVRTEVVCNRCRSHLGHVFDDGPAPTGMRYCMNSAALELDTSVAPPPAK